MADLNPEQWSHYTTRINGINIHYVLEGEGEPVLFPARVAGVLVFVGGTRSTPSPGSTR